MRTLVTAIVIACAVALVVTSCEAEQRVKPRKMAMDAACQVIVEAGLVKSCGVR